MNRRHLLAYFGSAALAGLSSCAKSCAPTPGPPPPDSPIYRGRHAVSRAILGVTPRTSSVPLPTLIPQSSQLVTCQSGSIQISTPASIVTMVYYPSLTTSYDVSIPIEIDLRTSPYPVVIYAHARRLPLCPENLPPGLARLFDISKDYTLIEFILNHVASHGCVVCAPDLSWGTLFEGRAGISARAAALVALFQHLRSLNGSTFSNSLDLNRVVLCGHSTGAAACLQARGDLVASGGPRAIAMVLLAPLAHLPGVELAPLAADLAPGALLVTKGTNDTLQLGVDPDAVYNAARPPKALVTIPGANHFGYTDLCASDNRSCAANDNPGNIFPLPQQLASAAYFSAVMRRFALEDLNMQPYLSGQKSIEFAAFGVSGLQLRQEGM